jgi:hypothetical protein
MLTNAALLLAGVVGTAEARPWAQWARAPLGSDSSFAALSEMPDDSLDGPQAVWLDVQRDWRAQRDFEAGRSRPGITLMNDRFHVTRPADERFAKLASLPFAQLSDNELMWLASENKEQQRVAETAKVKDMTWLFAIASAAVLTLVLVSHPDTQVNSFP